MKVMFVNQPNPKFKQLECFEKKKNLLASLAHSRRALRAQLARMSAPKARDLMVVALRAPIYVIVALRAPTYVNFALRPQCCALLSA